MYLSDYHLHTNWSPDGSSSMEDTIIEGIEKGVDELCFTDHFEIIEGRYQFPYKDYEVEFNRLKEKYKDRITLKLGIEIGLQYEKAKGFDEVIRAYPFDFVIGSTHRVDGKSPATGELFQGRSKLEAYRKYYEYMYKSIKEFENFDSFGHLDYVIRYGDFKDKGFKYSELSDILDKILIELIEKGKGIEVNTSYRRKGYSENHPHRDIIKRYYELGGRIITIGSDAHKKEDLATYVDEVKSLLKEIGFKEFAIYNKRKVEFKKL